MARLKSKLLCPLPPPQPAMPSFSLSPSKSKSKAPKEKALKEGGGANPSQSPMRKFSGKLAKKVKSQLWRLDEALHHVTRTQHNPNAAPRSSPPVIAKRKPPPVRERAHSLPAATFLRSVVPSSLRSSRSRDTWDVKYAKDRDSDRSSCCSEVHHLGPEHVVIAPLSADIVISESEPLKIEPVGTTATVSPPALAGAADHPVTTIAPREDDLGRSDEPNPFLDISIDLGSMPSYAEQQQDDTDVASPSLSLNAIQNETQPLSQEDSYDGDEFVITPCVRTLVVPTPTFSPLLPNMRHPFSTNLLTWWLCRTVCTK